MIQTVVLIQSQYFHFRSFLNKPIKKQSQQRKQNNFLLNLDDTVDGFFHLNTSSKKKVNTKEQFHLQSGSSLRLLFNQLALQIQTKPKVSTILISYLVCALYYLLNPYTLSKFNQRNIIDENNQSQVTDSSNTIIASQEDAIPYIILQFIAQDYFIYTSVRLFFHDSFIRKIEVKDMLITFWLLYGCSTLFLVFILTCIQSHWMNMLIFTLCYSVLIFQYQKEQNSFKNLFQMSMNFEQLLRSSRRRRNQDGEQVIDENQQNQEQQDQQQNVNNQNAQAGHEYDSDEQDEQNHNEDIRLNQRRVNFSNHRANPIVTELVQQFVGEHYERNQVTQLIQVSSCKWIVIYKVNHVKYISVFAGKSRLSTQKIDNNYIILKYYSDSIEKQASPYSINEETKKKYINIGVIYNTFSGKLLLFTVTPKGIKYLQTLDVGIVNKEHIVLHQQQPKFVTIRLKDLIFKDFIKNGMSSQTLVDYQNRVLQAYYSIDDTDYVVSIEEETLIISTILSTVEWKPIGHDWEMELMMGNHEPSNNLSPAQSTLLKNHQYYDKRQYFIQQKIKTKDFPTSIKSVNILNRRHLFIQDETHFYVYSIPTSQVLKTIQNNYIQGFSIIPINSTINSPNLTIEQFLKIQNFVQKRIAEALATEANTYKSSAITTENPTLIYLSQYTSIPITFTKNQDNTIQKIIFILPKCIQSTAESAMLTDNLFQIKSNTLQNILDSSSQ
ncbi:transmembrane protein, putative (macronuclear) [Tetrahymena thermophila SB210]|uniref:Transmembrane protein, putative n=1 Tax=Tetrahymena thermophila (strain SB210) TaxID=312017 RepID=W7XDK2_TETTS|nr:transmembrane protein, putative [Tetrahymena thermophila SB210]EWS75652.1 transmembrane protein, putative [Tetrahymena thermophila SB210]|eukprot:XP_012651798.1 transmembrane protein, putative [Tetrahymena thermophila SB210]